VIEMKKIIVSISIVIVALAMIFGLPAWEEEESPVAAENMVEDQNHEMTETDEEFEEEMISENLTAVDLSVDEGLSEASGP
jgi:uncharacterized protein (DUF305 family)